MGKCDKWQKDYEKMQSSGVVKHELMHLISPPPCKRHPKRGEGGGGSWDAVNVHRKRNVTDIVWPKNVCKTASYESKACLPPRIVPASYSVHFSETPVLGMIKRKMQMLFSL